MTYVPVIPMGGLAGWTFLNRTLEKQKIAADADPATKRDEDYFRQKIGSIATAEDLVSDRRLLKVALGAFGLDDDINNKFFIRKILQEGTTDGDALANKLADKSYARFAAAFGFGPGESAKTVGAGFADQILQRYSDRQFESAVGDQNEDMRLALNARRELTELASDGSSDATRWYKVLGSPPLRSVFQTAFGLSSAFASLDLDQQVRTLKTKMKAAFGDDAIAQFSDSARIEKFLQRFLVRSDSATTPTTGSGSAALAILQGSGSSGGILDLLT